jgi:hypothetical protein
MADFSHVGLIFGRRYAPTALANESVDCGGAGIATNVDFCLSVNESSFTQGRIGGRKSRYGYFFRFGNEIHHHQKTGGGAFSQICPHFDNDITWVDPSAWRNGSSQNQAWEINLFGNIGSPSLNIGQAAQRAGTW